MKTTLKVLIISILTIVPLAFAGYLFYNHTQSTTPVQEKVISETKKETPTMAKENNEDTLVIEPPTEEPTIEEKPVVQTGAGIMSAEQAAAEFPLNITEVEVQNAIHAMSHQKVRAEKKTSALQITPERIARLIEVVENNQYENKEVFLEILRAWQAEDYSQVVQHHNTIWDLQDGEVGKAYGRLNSTEEEEFIAAHFQ